MGQDRKTGVTEAGLALTVLTCLTVALGYFVLQRLGGTGETPTVEQRPHIASRPDHTVPPAANGPQQPEMLDVENQDSPVSPDRYEARKPKWLAPQQ